MEQNSNILIVDDEKPIQRSLKRSFFGMPFHVETASSGMEGLEILSEKKIDLVISDFKMPQMDGMEFLKEVRQKHPEVIRMMMSGYIDKEKLMDSLFQFNTVSLLPKPWDEDLLQGKIESYLEISQSVENRDLWKRINSVSPSDFLTSTYREGEKLEDFLMREPGLMAGLLHMFNSDYYNGGGKIAIKELIDHFSKETIDELIERSSQKLTISYPYDVHDFRSKFESKYQGEDKTTIPFYLFSLFSHIYKVCTKTPESEPINYIEEVEGKIAFTDQSRTVLPIVSTYLQLWNTAQVLTDFAKELNEKAINNDFYSLKEVDRYFLATDYAMKSKDERLFDLIRI